MNIDINYKSVIITNHPIFKNEVRYYFGNMPVPVLVGETYEPDYKEALDYPISIEFTEKELEAFRPKDGVQNFLGFLRQDKINEAKHLKNYKKSQYCTDTDRERIDNRIAFLNSTSVVFVRIVYK